MSCTATLQQTWDIMEEILCHQQRLSPAHFSHCIESNCCGICLCLVVHKMIGNCHQERLAELRGHHAMHTLDGNHQNLSHIPEDRRRSTSYDSFAYHTSIVKPRAWRKAFFGVWRSVLLFRWKMRRQRGLRNLERRNTQQKVVPHQTNIFQYLGRRHTKAIKLTPWIRYAMYIITFI